MQPILNSILSIDTGGSPSPYTFDIDQNGRLWYSNMHKDIIGCLDPRTRQALEYPLLFSENTTGELLLDAQACEQQGRLLLSEELATIG